MKCLTQEFEINWRIEWILLDVDKRNASSTIGTSGRGSQKVPLFGWSIWDAVYQLQLMLQQGCHPHDLFHHHKHNAWTSAMGRKTMSSSGGGSNDDENNFLGLDDNDKEEVMKYASIGMDSAKTTVR